MSHGVVVNWDDMEKVWEHAFGMVDIVIAEDNEVDEDCSGVLFTEVPKNPRENRERTTQIMFESFKVRRFGLQLGSALALYASGRTTGIVLDSGAEVTHAVPVYEGHPVDYACGSSHLAGDDVAQFLCKILMESKIILDPRYRAGNRMKEALCRVSTHQQGFDVEAAQNPPGITTGREKEFEMPDGTIVKGHPRTITSPLL